jgi:hypothetical protein
MRGQGRLRVTHGENAVARTLAWLLRLPRAGDAVETRLVVTPCAGGEHWQRTLGGHPFNSRQYPAGNGDIAERFGLLELRFRRDEIDNGTSFRQTGAALVAGRLRIPLPRLCAPAVSAREDRIGPRTRRINVRVVLPLVGPVLTYKGTIDFDEEWMDCERAQRSEPRDRSEPAQRRARERAGESEGRSPSVNR